MAAECVKEAIKIGRVLVKERECKDMLIELGKLEKLEAAKEKVRLKKMDGFLFK